MSQVSGKLVRPERFELPTYCSGGNRSIQTELRAHNANYTFLFDLTAFAHAPLRLIVARCAQNCAQAAEKMLLHRVLGRVNDQYDRSCLSAGQSQPSKGFPTPFQRPSKTALTLGVIGSRRRPSFRIENQQGAITREGASYGSSTSSLRKS
jgi:hypothetical protein